MQDKSYSRDWLVRGRIRVELKSAQGKPIVPDIPTRKSKLTLFLGCFNCRAAYRWRMYVAEVKQLNSILRLPATCTLCMQVLH